MKKHSFSKIIILLIKLSIFVSINYSMIVLIENFITYPIIFEIKQKKKKNTQLMLS